MSRPPEPIVALTFYGTGIGFEPVNSTPRPLGMERQAFTIEFWFWLEKSGQSSAIFGLSDPAGTFLTLLIESDDRLGLMANDVYPPAKSTGTVPVHRWMHFAIRFSPSSTEVLRDGIAVITTGPSNIAFPTGIPSLAETLYGSFRQLRLWKTALTNAEVRRYSIERPEASDPRLAAWWPMDDVLRHGPSAFDIEDLTPGDFHIHNHQPIARWVRGEVLEDGPHFVARRLERVEHPNPPLFIDFDRDGDSDIYSLQGFLRHQMTISSFPYFAGDPPSPDKAFRNNGAAGFSDATVDVLKGARIQGYLCRALFAADFTGDGIKDVFIADAGPELEQEVFAPDSLRVGGPDGTLTNESAQRVQQKNTYDHRSAIGDIDGDGDLDILSAGTYIEVPTVTRPYNATVAYINDGRGNFTIDSSRVPLEYFQFTSVALLDADLDGDIDGFLGNNNDYARNQVVINDGTGRFSVAPTSWAPPLSQFPENTCFQPPANCRQAVHLLPPVDLNRDGILDLVSLDVDHYIPIEYGLPVDQWRDLKQTLQLIIGNGDGTFRDGSKKFTTILRVPTILHGIEQHGYTGWLAFGSHFDQNGDGWPDLLLGSNGFSPSLLFINRGSAAWEEAGDVLGGPASPGFHDTDDMDRDGDDDVAADDWILENVKPWKPNQFSQTNLRLRMSVATGTTLTQTVDIDNMGNATAREVSASVPVPHGYAWSSTDAQGANCVLDGHVVLCTRVQLAAGERWQMIVRSSRQANSPTAAAHAVASVTADVFDSDLTDNVSRVPITP